MTTFNRLPTAVQAEMSMGAMRAYGIEEGPPAVMRFARLRQLLGQQPQLQHDEAVMKYRDHCHTAACAAKRRLDSNPLLRDFYTLRGIAVQTGRDPDADPTLRSAVSYCAARRRQDKLIETPDQKLQRLAAMDPLFTVEQFAAMRREQWFSPLDYSKPAVDQRREHAKLVRSIKDAKRILEQRNRERTRELSAQAAELSAMFYSDPAPESARSAAEAYAAKRSAMTWAQRAIDDVALLAQMGLPLPRAQRHLLAHVPLWERPTHWVYDPGYDR